MKPDVDELQYLARLLAATLTRMDQAVDKSAEVSERSIAICQWVEKAPAVMPMRS